MSESGYGSAGEAPREADCPGNSLQESGSRVSTVEGALGSPGELGAQRSSGPTAPATGCGQCLPAATTLEFPLFSQVQGEMGSLGRGPCTLLSATSTTPAALVSQPNYPQRDQTGPLKVTTQPFAQPSPRWAFLPTETTSTGRKWALDRNSYLLKQFKLFPANTWTVKWR